MRTISVVSGPLVHATNGRPSAPAPAPATPPSLVEVGWRRVVVVTGIMLAALLQMIDTTIVNVSLPTIQGNLGATIDDGVWIVTGYVVANVVVIPLVPWLQRRFGRKRYLLVSIAGFTVTSLLCGMATTLDALILFRIAQGAFGGGLLGTAQMVLRDTFGPAELGLSQSIFAFATVIGPSIGPMLGGVITDNATWPWIFDVNVVPGVVAFVLLWRFLRDSGTPQRLPVDAPGLALLVLTLGALQYALDQGQRYDWFSDPRIVTAFALTIAGGAGFVCRELRTAAPLVDLRVLRVPAVAAASLLIAANATGIFGVALLLPQFTVDHLGFTSTGTGVLLGLRALPVVLLSLPIGRITNDPRLDLRWLIGAGLLVNGIGAAWIGLSISTDASAATFIVPLLVQGVGAAFVYSPLLVAMLRAVPPDLAPRASSFVILSFQLAGSVVSALLVTLLDRREAFHHTTLAGAVTRDRAPIAALSAIPDGIARLAHLVGEQAIALAYRDAVTLAGIVVALLVPAVVFLRRRTV